MRLQYSKCTCGAITLYLPSDENYSCKEENIKTHMPGIDFTTIEQLQDTFCCNHCVNHYGLDLCACGSGEPVGQCSNDFDVCNQPMQILFGRTSVRADDAIGY